MTCQATAATAAVFLLAGRSSSVQAYAGHTVADATRYLNDIATTDTEQCKSLCKDRVTDDATILMYKAHAGLRYL